MRTPTGTYLVVWCLELVQGWLSWYAVLFCALLCSRLNGNHNIHTRTKYCCTSTAVAAYRYSGSARFSRLQRIMDRNERYISGANRRHPNASMLEGKQTGRIMHVRTYLVSYVLWSACAWFAALCRGNCDVLCCARSSTTNDIYPILLRPWCLLLYTYGYRIRHTKYSGVCENNYINEECCGIKCSRTTQLCMLASVVVWYVRKKMHCKAWHSRA